MDRPRCVSCHNVLHNDEHHRVVCTQCELSAKENLEKLAGQSGLFAKLVWAGVDALSPEGGRKSSGPVVRVSKVVAPPPVRMGTMNLLGAGGVVQTLQRWVREWYAEIGFREPTWSGPLQYQTVVSPSGQQIRRPGQLDRTVLMLTNNLPWAVEHRLDFGKFMRDARRFVEASEEALDPNRDKPDKVLVGRCPTTAHEGACGAQLMADPFATSIKCWRCGTVWDRAQWPDLGRTLRGK